MGLSLWRGSVVPSIANKSELKSPQMSQVCSTSKPVPTPGLRRLTPIVRVIEQRVELKKQVF